MMLPDPFDLTTLSRPDTEIKLFVAEDASGQGGRIELLRALRRAKGSGAQVFHVAEPMLVSINLPYRCTERSSRIGTPRKHLKSLSSTF